MSNYNSTHTGAELDEAIGRVIDGGSIKVQVDTNTTNISNLQVGMTASEKSLLARNYYAECVASQNNVEKQVVVPGFVLSVGGNFRIKMTNQNVKDDVTLNVFSAPGVGTGAKPLFFNGSRASSTNTWRGGQIIQVYYDGENYISYSLEDFILPIKATSLFSIKDKSIRKTGLTNPDTGFFSTDFIPVTPGETVTIGACDGGNSAYSFLCYYKKDGSFLSTDGNGEDSVLAYAVKTLVVPTDAAYMRCCTRLRYLDYSFVNCAILPKLLQGENILEDKLEYFSVKKVFSVNLFNRKDPRNIYNKHINAAGVIADLTNSVVTHPIFVEKGTTIKVPRISSFFGEVSRMLYLNTNEFVTSTSEIVDGQAVAYLFDIPKTGLVLFNCKSTEIGQFMVCRYDLYPDTYVPFSCKVEEGVDFSDIPKADLTDELGKNLFNKAAVINGYYILSTTGTVSPRDVAVVSQEIEISPNTVYYLSRPDITTSGAVRFLTDELSVLKPLRTDGVEWTSFEPSSTTDTGNTVKGCKFKSPPTAKYIQFTIRLNEGQGDENNTQLEIGPDFTGYEPYQLKKVVPYSQLPKELIDQLGEATAETRTINIANSDKIGVFSTSFMNGYAMKNHHHLNHLSMLLDYIFYNYGHSGDDELENLAKLNNDSPWLGIVPPSQWNIRYGIIMHQENSGALFAASSDTVYQNSKKLANAVKSLGGIPIFSTEHDQVFNYYQGALRLCEEEGYMFMNWGRGAYLNVVKPGIFKPFWYSGHPATRTGWITTLGMLPYLKSLPRPKQSLKLFRVREGIDTSDLSNLVYDDYYSRAKRFVELTCGVAALTAAAEKYFDRLDAGTAVNAVINDEYQTLQSKQSVSFGDFVLAHIVTPYDRVNLKSAILNYSGTGITKAYVKKNLRISNPLPDRRYYAFGITAGEDLLSEGDTFVVSGISRSDGSDLNREWEVQGIVNGMLVTTTTSSPTQGWTNGKTSGVDEPICSITGVTLAGSYDYPSVEYMEKYKEPLGEWIELTIDNGKVDLTDYIPQCMDFDSIAILLKGNSITLSDIYVEVTGNLEKSIVSVPRVEYKNGTSIIADALFDDSTSWENISSLQTFDNTAIVSTVTPTLYEKLPIGISTVKELTVGQSTKQDIISSTVVQNNNDPRPIRLQFRVIARFFPKYVDSDSEWTNSEITEQSFDMARLAISIGKSANDVNPTKVAELSIGAYWYQYIFETFATQDQLSYVKVECTDKKVQIAKLEAVRID